MSLEEKKNTVSLTAVGDVLLHGRVYGGLKKRSNFTLDEQLANIKDYVGKTDISIANLETPIAGNELGLTGYPRFNAPVEIGYAIKNLGFDIVNLANNHALDKGPVGLVRTIDNLRNIGLEYVGAYNSFEDQDRLRIFYKNGLRICFVSYTRGTNHIPIPKDKPFLVNSLKEIKIERIISHLKRIKKGNLADIIVANLHFGEEYHLFPNETQRQLAMHLADAGADVILGHHPHVLQPPEWIENSHGTKTFVAYSLGNFFSGQISLNRRIGAVLTLDMKKPDEKYTGISIENVKYKLTYTNRDEPKKTYMYTLSDWVEKNPYIETEHGKFDSREVYENVRKRMQSYIPDLDID